MLFSAKKYKNKLYIYAPALVIVLVLIAFYFFSSNLGEQTNSHGKTIRENALTRSITQCYALEGSYPPNIKYLQDNYGLIYDSEEYFIDYQFIGSNLRPDVTVIERN